MDFNEEELRAQAKAYVDGGGTWKDLAQSIKAHANNLSAWARGGPGLVSHKKLSKIPSALTKLSANGGKKQ